MHRLVRSRGLRALGVLAWLMLAIGGLAHPASVDGLLHDAAAHATMVTFGEHAAHAGRSPAAGGAAHACCVPDSHGHDAGASHGCRCQGSCATALALPSACLVAPVLVAVLQARTGRVRAPTPGTVPPLRPPMA
ncbi:MAG TPA: hypothetical protein VGU65_12010 [Frateuria sp.]|uniref:hypothetical protein n=1 Tax=Frateuria sp. TaxID=2211372 RepID=UPI002DE3817F|nr:hypothetical protein [Frateuria sp.]